jgi:sulfur carrier protein ThiS
MDSAKDGSNRITSSDSLNRTTDRAPSQPDSQDELVTTTETITPMIAKALLGNAGPNRALSAHRVGMYASDMAAGRWKGKNGQTIVIDYNGQVIDGQHRLHAIILSGVTVTTLVVRGAEPAAQDTLDCNRARTYADALQIRGVKNAGVVAGAAQWLHHYDRDSMHASVGRVTGPQLEQAVARHPGVHAAAADVKANPRANRLASPSILGVFLTLGREYDADIADYILTVLETNAVTAHDPVYRLNLRLNDNRDAKAKLSERKIFVLMIKTFNALIEGRLVRSLVWRRTDPFPRFPTPAKTALSA